MANEEPKRKGGNSEALKRYHASRTPEQKAAWREKIAVTTAVGMDAWHARRTEEHKAHANMLIREAEICRSFTRRAAPSNVFKKGHRPVDNHPAPRSIALRDLTRVAKASIKRIIQDLVLDEPDKWREAIIRGRDARPPHSFPYVALAASYLDGRPREAEPPVAPVNDLSNLTSEELRQRALALVERLKAENAERALPVIDVEVIRDGDK